MKCTIFSLIVVLVLLCVIAQPSFSRTWHVNLAGSGDAPTISAAIDSASAGDTILCAPGNYPETGLYINKDIHLVSEAGADQTTFPNPFSVEAFIITCEGLSSNSSIVGFRIERGYSMQGEAGGGIKLINSSTAVRDNKFIQNQFGIKCIDGGSPIIRSNVFCYNSYYLASAIYIENASSVIDSNTILNNEAVNWKDTCGGAIVIDSALPVTVANNIIAFNTAVDAGGGENGGGVYVKSSPSNITFTCNLVFGNSPDNYCGMMADQTGMNGNISKDPEFCALQPALTNNYYLQSDSPCVPGNHPDGESCSVIGKYPMGCGATSVKKESWGKIKSLYKK